MAIKLKDVGVFFFKPKKATEIFNGVYIKGSYLVKKAKGKKLLKKKMGPFFAPGALYLAIFDDKGRDYISTEPISEDDFKKMINDFQAYYDVDDFSDVEELYKKMNISKIKKLYTLNWVDKQIQFLKNQLDQL
jgi:hypothetical protein